MEDDVPDDEFLEDGKSEDDKSDNYNDILLTDKDRSRNRTKDY